MDGLRLARGAPRPVERLHALWTPLGFLAALSLSACGGGGVGALESVDARSTIQSLISAEPAGAHCATGGVRVSAGVDADQNGKLDASEIKETQFVCKGAAGSLLTATLEAPGSNCAAGGIRVSSGRDADEDGVLDTEEVTLTQYVCNGTSGLAGASGAKSLVKVSTAAPGASCAEGGTRIEAGTDTNNDGVLGAAEVTSTAFVCRPSGVHWVKVTASAVQAERNTGYRAAGSADITITLPKAEDLNEGDLISVAGVGSGRWTVAQNEGQTIYGGNLGHIGVAWMPKEARRAWQSITSSADGSRLAAVEYGGQIYTSVDSGETWTARETNRLWYTIASSADGSKLVAGVPGGQLYTSSDGGVTWTARESARSWYGVAASADGSRLVAAAGGEQLYTSSDGGATWTARDSNRLWFSVASSADGTRLVAAEYGGQIYTSADAGVTWTPRETNRAWASVSSSSDGMRLVAVVFGGQIFTSADAGLTWSARDSTGPWIDVASSANGLLLVAAQAGGLIYTSSNGGSTWLPRFSNHDWASVCTSADGRQLFAAANDGFIHKSTPFSTRGTAGGLQGGAYDAIELQYQGDGLFMPLSHEGALTLF